MTNRVPAPGWQRPHVVARFLGLMVEWGSSEGRMLWTPWQLAQLATDWDPARAARPWKEASKLTMRSEGKPKRFESSTFPWHWPQVSRIWAAFTLERTFWGERISCSPWQLVQTGASAIPLATAFP